MLNKHRFLDKSLACCKEIDADRQYLQTYLTETYCLYIVNRDHTDIARLHITHYRNESCDMLPMTSKMVSIIKNVNTYV